MARPREHDDKVIEILRLLDLGWTVRQIAVAVGCGKSTVGNIKKGVRK